MIELACIGKAYQAGDQVVHAVKEINLTITKNELVAFTGTSGSGKSTVLNILGCLDRASCGSYKLNGRDVASLNRDELSLVRNIEIGFIFQSFNLLPRLSALDNVIQPLIYRGIARQDRRRLAEIALAEVGLESRQHHRPNELSGGQRQRVAIARALVGRPSILLADEPTGNLDSSTTKDILSLIKEVHKTGQTVVMVTHEPEVALECERVIQMRDGVIISDIRNNC